MVAKQISYHTRFIEEKQISSHMLKMATLWSMADAHNSSQSGVSSENDYSQLDSYQLQRQVEAIFRRLWQFSVQDFVPSFFMPSIHVAVWPFEIFPKYSHTFLRRTYSDYRKLFSSDLKYETGEIRTLVTGHTIKLFSSDTLPARPDMEKSTLHTRRDIKYALAYSFALLYAVSSHCSWSTDWVFPTIVDDDD